MDWDKLRIFHAVAEAGSFTHAGEVLNLSQSAVSRQISALEEQLHVTLFHRHARGLLVTEQGDLLYRTAREVYGRIAMAEAQLTDSKDRPDGHLTVTATTGFSVIWLMPRIVEFMDRYPEISITMRIEDGELDLSMREADVAIRMKEPSQADLIRKRLMGVRIRLFAAPGYVERAGMPATLAEMANHRLVCQNPATPQAAASAALVQSLLANHIRSTLTVNTYFGVLQAVLGDAGIGVLPDYITRDVPNLVRVLPEVESGEVPVFLAYPEELRHSKRVSAFRDFVIEEIMEDRRSRRG